MNPHSYPFDPSQGVLSAEYQRLAEEVARTQHQGWRQQRLMLGWQPGDAVDAKTQTHPHLVAYDELPEAIRQERRSQVAACLQTLLALGHQIDAAPGAPDQAHSPQPATLDRQILSRLHIATPDLDVNTLLAIHRETIRLQPRTPDVYLAMGDAILQLGEPLIAYDTLAEGLQQWPDQVPLQQRLALALARSGATHSAQALLVKLVEQGYQDDETLGLLARTHKDLWQQATGPTEARYHLEQAVQRYHEAYWYYNSVWTGINAATLSFLMGQTESAHQLAQRVRSQCLEQLADRPTTADPYWTLATIGEASLVLGDWTQAEDYYSQAAEAGMGRYGNLSSSCRNALLLVEYLGADAQQVKRWFRIPRIAMFCSQGLASATSPPVLIPPPLEVPLTAAIANTLERLDARLGYASAACGPDLLFLEAVRSLGGELHIVLPYNRDQFVRDAVDIVPGSNWIQRFEQVMDQASEVVFASDLKPQAHDVVYEYSHRLLHGLAKMRAKHLDTDLVPIALTDSAIPETAAATAPYPSWQQYEEPIESIDLAQIRAALTIQLPPLTAPRSTAAIAAPSPDPTVDTSLYIHFERQIRAMLFADVVQFTRLTEDQYFPFMQDFMGAIAQLSAEQDFEPLTRNTWGDAIYYVFPSIYQAGRFALSLCDLVQAQNWAELGLPADMNLRIALHAGPVYRSIDPITNRFSYFGAHVNHAARIEPITPPGKVYASQAFAAITCSEGINDFTCDYVGQMPWAKRYGTFPTYHVRWATPSRLSANGA